MENKTFRQNYIHTRDCLGVYGRKVVSKWYFYIPFILSIMISYAFTIFNRSLFIDDLAQQIYYGPEMHKIRSFRWGQAVTAFVFSTSKYTPFINQFLGVLFFVVTVIVLGAILYKYDLHKEYRWKYVIFSCIFVSFPLITEFFGYFESLTIPFHFFVVSIVLLYEISSEKQTFLDIFVEGLVLSLVMAGYESLIVVYVTEVMIVLFIKYVLQNGKHEGNWFLEGLRYARPLFIAIVLKYIIGLGFLYFTGNLFNTVKDGNTTIYWLTSELYNCIYNIVANFRFYILRGFSYFPIAEFACALLVFFGICIKYQKKSKYSLIIGFLIVASIFTLSFIQGNRLFYRQAQSVQLFTAYVMYLILDEVTFTKIFNKRVHVILAFLLLFVCLRQSIFTHRYLALDNQRSDNERNAIQNIGHRLYSEYDRDKTIVFCGKYHLGKNIESQIFIDRDGLENKVMSIIFKGYKSNVDRKFVETNVNSVINWALRAFNNQNMMKELLSYYGYELNVTDELFNMNTNAEYERIALQNNMKAMDIKDMGDYILVYFGKID